MTHSMTRAFAMTGERAEAAGRLLAALLFAAFVLTLSARAAGAEEVPPETPDAIIENMIGDSSAEPIRKKVLQGYDGQELFLDRRAYLTRYAAIRSVPQKVLSWRAPGSQMGKWVEEVRKAAGVPLSDISKNPSYKEVMHALTVDRFNSGKYAAGMLTDQSAIEKEKLMMSVFYLMQLRDYYELMERTALTLSVEVAMLADEKAVPDAQKVRK